MTRLVGIATVSALFLAANRVAAGPTQEGLGQGLPRSELAFELGGAASFSQRTRRLGDAESGEIRFEQATAEAASWMIRFSRAWWVGPRLGAEQYFNISDEENLSHTIHLLI